MDDGHATRLLNLIVIECPRLKSLFWDQNYSTPYLWPQVEFCDHLHAGTWPHLEFLTVKLSYDVFRTVCDRIFKGGKIPFKKLHLPAEELHSSSFNILKERHFSVLQDIDLSVWDCSSANMSPWVQDILASCPSLEIIRAKPLRASCIFSGAERGRRPWICRRLKEFRVPIDLRISENVHTGQFTEEEQRLSWAVYQQLAIFQQLQVLDLQSSRGRYHRDNYYLPLPLQLDMGLGLLSGLTKLELVYFSKHSNLGRGDVLWIVQHWKGLKEVGGQLGWKSGFGIADGGYVWDYELSRILHSHGVVITPRSEYKAGYLDEWDDSDDSDDSDDWDDSDDSERLA